MYVHNIFGLFFFKEHDSGRQLRRVGERETGRTQEEKHGVGSDIKRSAPLSEHRSQSELTQRGAG